MNVNQTTPDEEAALGGWPEPAPIDNDLPAALPFDLQFLPSSLRDWVADNADRMQVPLDFPGAVAVLGLAGCVNRRARIQPKAADTSWSVVPCMWGGIVAAPGLLKSPVIHEITRPLRQIQELWWNEQKHAESEYAREKEEYDLRHQAWKDKYKQLTKRGQPVQSWTENEPERPRMRRLIVNDATMEALHETLAANPSGVLVMRDELTGWWSQLDRPGREGERAFYLQSWNGDTAHTIDRIGRGSIHVPACALSMLGGIQPARLRSYLVDAVIDGPANDGLIQRFQVLVWPDTPQEWRYVDRPPNAKAAAAALCVFERLVSLDPENPTRLKFSEDAQLLFIAWLTELERKVRDSELHPALASHLAKYRRLMPALSALFELADSGTGEVSLEHAQQSAAMCEYLESHAQRIYSCIVTPQLRAARELAHKIKTHKIGANGVFSRRDVYLKGWSALDTPDAVQHAAKVLEEAGWVRSLPQESGPAGGRPSDRYEINPRYGGREMSRWFTWQPPHIFKNPPEQEPSKPTKLGFDGFEGSVSRESQKIEAGFDGFVGSAAGVSIAVWEDGSMHVVVTEADAVKARDDGGTIYSPEDMYHYVTLTQAERRMLHQFKKRFGGKTEWRQA